MGHGTFSYEAYNSLSETRSYAKKSAREIFNKELHEEMDPIGVNIRESRDSEEHPNSLAVQLWLDVTGSMHRIPESLIKETLPHLMLDVMDAGIKSPQLFFGAIGDHTCDRNPLQVGQFESDTELVVKWLTGTHLEGGGGGNDGESYLLAWYFAAKHTSIDCFEKRGQKGFLFTVGDEKCLPVVSGEFLKRQMGTGQYASAYTREELLAEAQRSYNVYHIHANDGSYRNNQGIIGDWKGLLGDNLIVVDNHKDIASTIANIVKNNVETAAYVPVTADVENML